MNKEEIKIEVNKILDLVYWLYMKEKKDGNIGKNKYIASFGKVIKKKSFIKKNDMPNLFGY